MLTDTTKTSILWKKKEGWGSTHPERETFEELYRSYKDISTNSVLTYGDLLPRKKGDTFFDEVKALDATSDTVYYVESSFKTVPLVKKHTELRLTAISPNCDHAFAILDRDGNQIRNIIPYDFSDEGIYNYTLKTADGKEIPWGICDWLVDVNASILTFNNGTPEDISAAKPPVLTFYQYVGPVGERHYIEAALMDVERVVYPKHNPVFDITDYVKETLENIEPGFFERFGFGGNDTTTGIGLQYNILSNVIETGTADPLKGYDDNSKAQVVSLLSHKKGKAEGDIEVLFVSEGLTEDGYDLQVVDEGEQYGIAKIDLEDGFVVVKAKPGNYRLLVENDTKAYAVLLVKDDETQNYELFYPREDLDVTIKLPVFADLIRLPPHLKLTALASYSDHITPQYYGPRVFDFVVATDQTENWRSADYVVYNKEGFYLSDAILHRAGTHVYLRNGIYESKEELHLPSSVYLHGESRRKAVVKNTKLVLDEDSAIECIRFEDCEVTVKHVTAFKMCDFINTKVFVENGQLPATMLACSFGELTIDGNEHIEGCQIENLKVTGSATIFNSAILTFCENEGTLELYGDYVKDFKHTKGKFFIHSSHIEKLDCTDSEKGSILDTTAIDYVENLPDFVKIDTSYVTKFSENIERRVYPDEATIPYYSSFERRVYAKLPDPFLYDEETNKLNLKLDTIEHTIFINKNGELQTRFFSSKEIWIPDPEANKTQIEDVYAEHADTVLNKPKPESVDEALIDLYWSKADLKNGKVPISQLPDSVAHGGLELVGMWSFEDSKGEYPTFEDVDTKFGSDDEYTDLQNGWFFIVSASHKEDDPVYPQLSKDGVEWTAGDWVIYTGGKRHTIDFSKPVRFSYRGTDAKLLEERKDSFVYEVPLKDSVKNAIVSPEDSGLDASSSEDSSEVENYGTVTVDKEGKITGVYNLPEDFKVDETLKDVTGLLVKEYQYKMHTDGDSWSKLDRAYLDPVYSRLPEFATVTDGENPAWSIADGGTGLLRLSFLSLAEAVRLINESLLKLSPDRPAAISELDVVLDEENTTANSVEVFQISNGLQLNRVVNEVIPKVYWEAGSGEVHFKQKGAHDYLPLENCFYCGLKSEIKVLDQTADITGSTIVERFDPYQRYRLGFRAPTFIDAANVTGFVELGKSAYRAEHKIHFTQFKLEKSPYVTTDVTLLEGETKTPFVFTESQIYKLKNATIQPVESSTLNSRVINLLLEQLRTGGYAYLPFGTEITGAFVIKDFAKYGIVGKDAKVELRAFYGEDPIYVEIEEQSLIETSALTESYDLRVAFTARLPEDGEYEVKNFSVEALVTNFGKTIGWTGVLTVKDVTLINKDAMQDIVESGNAVIWPTLGSNSRTNFGAAYTVKTPDQVRSSPELVWEYTGYGWPERKSYLESLDVPSVYVTPDLSGIDYKDNLYRFITFKHSFDSIHDLCGFSIHFEWTGKEPTLNKVDGTYENVTLQVCVKSNEMKNAQLSDANKAVPVFFEATFAQGEACNHPGKSSVNVRKITFGRKPVPVQDIYIRVGIAKGSGIRVRRCWITED